MRPALTQQWAHAGSACSHAACVISPGLAACVPRGTQTQAADETAGTAAIGSRAAVHSRHLRACCSRERSARLTNAADVTTSPRYCSFMHVCHFKSGSIHSDATSVSFLFVHKTACRSSLSHYGCAMLAESAVGAWANPFALQSRRPHCIAKCSDVTSAASQPQQTGLGMQPMRLLAPLDFSTQVL